MRPSTIAWLAATKHRTAASAGLRRAGSASAIVVMAGLLTPLSAGEAMAACDPVTTGGGPEVIWCEDDIAAGYSKTSNADLQLYAGSDTGTKAEIGDGVLISNGGTDKTVSVGLFGAHPDFAISNVFQNSELSGIFPVAAGTYVPLTLSNAGVSGGPATSHALQINMTVRGDVNLVTLGEVDIKTTGSAKDGFNIATNGGKASVATSADFDVMEDGIDIDTNGGQATVSSSGTIIADVNGIKVDTSKTGGGGAATVTIEDGGSIEAATYGVSVTAGTGIATLTVDGNIKTGNSAISASGKEVRVTVGDDALVTGTGSNAVVLVGSTDGSVVVNNGKIAAGGADINAQAQRVAIQISGGATTLTNDGEIVGRFTGKAGNDELTNRGTWRTKGTIAFSTGTDTLDNFAGSYDTDKTAAGLIVNAFDTTSKEITSYTGLETFTNSGEIRLVDQNKGDAFMRDRATTEGDFIGQGGLISVDVDLAAQDADRFMIEGNVSGTTYVGLNIIAEGVVFSEYGIPIIGVGGTVADGTTFELFDGPIQAGLFTYDLYYAPDTLDQVADATSLWVLAGTAGAEAFQLPAAAAGATNVWQASAAPWVDRTTDLRDRFSANGGGGGSDVATAGPGDGTGLWGQLVGGTMARDFTNVAATPGGSVSFVDSFRQTYYGVVGGADAALDIEANGTVFWGLLGGLTGADLDFALAAGGTTYQQASLGAYASYVDEDGVFADILTKLDIGQLTYSTGGSSAGTVYSSVGVTADVGYRIDTPIGWFVEPKGTIAFVQTRFEDDLSVLGSAIALDDGTSMKAGLSTRIGTTIDHDGMLITPYLEASLWNELSGKYGAAIAGIGGTPAFNYDGAGAYGEVTAGVDFTDAELGWSAFGKGAVQVGGSNLLGFSGNLGIKKSW